MIANEWPPLPYEEWRKTRDTLHMYTQVVGKLRLALSPFEPEWANVPLYVTARGLTTSPVPVGLRTVDVEFDLIDHVLTLRTSDGLIERRALGGPVADFHRDVMSALGRMGVEVTVSPLPSEVANPIPFPDDREHHTYDAVHATRFFRVLSMADVVMKQHRARFSGRTTLVHFFWGTFDLALTRYSGRPADPAPGAGVIARASEDAEEICAGWWSGDERIPYPAFYAYAFPSPEGIEDIAIRPVGAAWNASSGQFLLPYEAARAQPDPQQAILDFLESTFEGAAKLQRWSGELLPETVPKASAMSRASWGGAD